MKSRSHCFAIAHALLLTAALPCLAASEFVLSRGGQPKAEIFVLPESGLLVEKAVADLQDALKKMTGSSFVKATSLGDSPAVIVGLASEWTKLTGEEAPLKELASAAPESFLLRSTPERLLILGRDTNGVSHGIYTVLRDLGCRWYFMEEAWTVIPEKKDIQVSVDRVEGPAFRMRMLSNGSGHGTGVSRSRQLLEDWSRRNRQGSAYGTGTIHHSYANFVPNALFKEHPEWFAWVSKDGESKGTFQNGLQPCTTHPEVIKKFTEGALARLRKERELTGKSPLLLSVSPNDDTPNMCRCERCMETGTYGDTALLLCNQVAEAIHAEFPDTLVGFLAYGRPGAIPEKVRQAHPNVIVGIATNYNWKNSVQRLLQEWPKLVAQSLVREYYAIPTWGSRQPDNTMPNVEYISQTLRSWNEKGIDGINAEIANDWASCGLRFWAFAELSWNPSLRPEDLREDFYKNAWGVAAEPMRRYFERWESGQPASPRALRLAMLDLEKAASLAAGHPQILRRVDEMSLYLYWFLLSQAYTVEKDDEVRNQIALEGDLFQYRWRNSYMTQLIGAIFAVHRTAPMGFTPEEVAKFRQVALERFLPATVGEAELNQNFSTNLVSPGNVPSGSQDPVSLVVSRASYLFRAKAGEVVNLVLSTGDLADQDGGGGIPAKPTGDVVRVQFFSLGAEGRDQGFIVEESKPLSAGEPIQLAWTAPKDGLYRINVQTTDRNGRVAVDFGERPHVMAVHPVQRKDFLPLVKAPARKTSADDQDMMPNRFFFYVPSGTKAFVVNARRTSPRDPVAVQFFSLQDEQIEDAISTAESECLIQVPASRDGTIWEVRTERDMRYLSLEGVPPWVATRPELILIPQEFVR